MKSIILILTLLTSFSTFADVITVGETTSYNCVIDMEAEYGAIAQLSFIKTNNKGILIIAGDIIDSECDGDEMGYKCLNNKGIVHHVEVTGKKTLQFTINDFSINTKVSCK